MPIITEQSIFHAIGTQVSVAEQNIFRAQQQASSGLRVATPSDDPVATARGTLIDASLRSLGDMQRISAVVDSQLQAAHQGLSGALTVLARARELAVEAGNGALGGDERSFIASEMRGLRDTMVQMANTEEAGIYVFAGDKNVAPFDDTGAYFGDGGTRQVTVGPGIDVQVNLAGSSVFAPSTGDNVIAVLTQLVQDLSGNNIDGIQEGLTSLVASTDQIVGAQAQLGAQIGKVVDADVHRVDLDLVLRHDRSRTMDVGEAESLSNLVQAQAAFQAAVTQAAKIMAELQNSVLLR